MSSHIYLDYNASTPIADEVAAAMEPFLKRAYGNPSSHHWAGTEAREAVGRARSQVARLLQCESTEVIFTSGGTEANNYAIQGLFFRLRLQGKPFHVITSRIEHPAVLKPCQFVESLGAEVTRLAVDRNGLVDPNDILKAIRPDTALVSIMHANNEVGSIQPISEIAAITRERGIVFHTDAAQSVGKVLTDIDTLGVDLLSIAGHKLYAPKGVGALIIRQGIELTPLLHGARHESGRRAGTENVLQIVGLGAACELAQSWIGDHRIRELRDHFWRELQSHFGDRVLLNGHPEHRLPNTLNVNFLGQSGNEILARMPNIAASTGSACHSGADHISPVLDAMGVSHEAGLGAIRFSLGRSTNRAEIDAVVHSLREALKS